VQPACNDAANDAAGAKSWRLRGASVNEDGYTDFGFERVAERDKQRRVRAVFDSVAARYDLMNDLMSFGLHRLWKRFAVLVSCVRDGHDVLDLAGGTGDLARLLHARVGDRGSVTLADINGAMLRKGRARLLDEGLVAGLRYAQVDAQALPFPDASFDCVTIGFGLRNVTRKERALEEMYRVLRPGGLVLVLEFSQLRVPLARPLYDLYSFKMLPWLGRRVAQDPDSYRYLAESIRMHPDQAHLAQMMREAGFEDCEWFNLALGVVALHRGRRL
jgi:demethylmenaquinone methyltransferase/2-methoxy-6-polyprenyl-1,4-benzoquinol methylase